MTNQINNAITFPGVLKAIVEKRKPLNLKIQIKIAQKIAKMIEKPTKNKIIPFLFDKRLIKVISKCF